LRSGFAKSSAPSRSLTRSRWKSGSRRRRAAAGPSRTRRRRA